MRKILDIIGFTGFWESLQRWLFGALKCDIGKCARTGGGLNIAVILRDRVHVALYIMIYVATRMLDIFCPASEVNLIIRELYRRRP